MMTKSVIVPKRGILPIRNGIVGPVNTPTTFHDHEILVLLAKGFPVYEVINGQRIELTNANFNKLIGIEDIEDIVPPSIPPKEDPPKEDPVSPKEDLELGSESLDKEDGISEDEKPLQKEEEAFEETVTEEVSKEQEKPKAKNSKSKDKDKK